MEEDAPSTDVGTESLSQIDSAQDRICKRFLQGSCVFGKSCFFKHNLYLIDEPCKFYFTSDSCFFGSQCAYSHCGQNYELDSGFAIRKKRIINKEECLFFNQGFCASGPNCKFKHVKRTLCKGINKFGACSKPNCTFYHISSFDDKGISTKIFKQYTKLAYESLNPETDSTPYKKIFDLCSDCLTLGHFFHECPKKSQTN